MGLLIGEHHFSKSIAPSCIPYRTMIGQVLKKGGLISAHLSRATDDCVGSLQKSPVPDSIETLFVDFH